MGFWDVLLFNIAAVLGPRWIAAAAHNGTSSISLWILAALLFFVPTAFVVLELSTRFPHEGGLYAWSKEAFGEFHGFVAGWTYWVYTFFYFPGLLMASAAMAAYVGGGAGAHLANDRTFLIAGSLALLFVAVVLNIVGLDIGKWLQNAGGIGTYIPLVMLIGLGAYIWHARVSDALHAAQHDAGLGLEYREFLAADCVRVYRHGAGGDDGGGDSRAASDVPTRNFWFGAIDCGSLYCGNGCDSGDAERAGRRSKERCVRRD